MKLFTLRGAPVSAHPMMPLALLVSLLMGREGVLAAVLALAVHEAGHWFAATGMRMRVEEVELTPFGGVMTLPFLESEPPLRAGLLAAAGPAASLLACVFASALTQWGWLTVLQARPFFRASAALLLFNLLPALPLDGGRVLRAVCRQKCERPLAVLGGVTGAALIALSVASALRGQFVPAPALAGVYLLYSGAVETRRSSARYIHALLAKRERLARGDVLRAQTLAARFDTPLFRVACALSPGGYHTVRVLDATGLVTLGTLDEDALSRAILDGGAHSTLSDALTDTGTPRKGRGA